MKKYLPFSVIFIFALTLNISIAFGEKVDRESDVTNADAEQIEEDIYMEEDIPDLTVGDSLEAAEALLQMEADLAEALAPEEIPNPGDSTTTNILPPPAKPDGVEAIVSWDGGAGTNNWNDALNWSNDLVPTSADNVTLGSGANVQLIDGNDGNCLDLTIQNGASLTIGSKTLTVASFITVDAGGALYLSGTIYLAGNWTINGTFSPNSGSAVRFNGSNQSIGAANFYDVYMQNSGTKTATGSLDIDGDLRVYTGVTFDPSTYDHTIADDFENDGTLALGTGTITLDGTDWQSVYSNDAGSAPGTWNFNNLIVSGNAGSVGIYDTVSVNGNLTVNGGEALYLRHYNITNPSEGIVNGNGGTFTLLPDAGLYIRTERTNGTGGADDNFPSGFNTVDLAYGSTSSYVYYQSNVDQIVRSQDGDGDPIVYGRILFRELTTGNYPTKQPDGDLDVNNYFNIGANVTFDITAGNFAINVEGYWYNYGTFTPRGGTVTLDGATQQITGNNSTTFNNLTISGTGNKTLARTTTVNGTCTISSGVSYLNIQTFTLSGGGSSSFVLRNNVLLYVRGGDNFPDFNSYSIDPGSTVRYDMGGNQTVKTGIDYGRLYLYNGSTKTVDLDNLNLTAYGRLQIGANTTFDIWDGVNPFTLNLHGDYYNYGTLDATQAVLNLIGANDIIFYSGGTGAGKPIYNLTINKTGGKAILGSAIKIDNDLSITNGTFGMESTNRNIYIDGDWSRSPGTTFLHGTGRVYFQGTSQSISGTASDDFHNVDITGGTKTLASNIDVNGRIDIQSGAALDVSASNYNLFVGGIFDNDNGGSFDGRNGTVIFDGSENATLYIGATDSLNNLTLNKSAAAYLNYDEHDLRVGGNVLVQNGQLYSGYNSSTSQYTDMIVYGNWTNNGSFRADRADTVFFMGAGQSISASGTDDFNYVVFGGTGIKIISSNVDVNRSINVNTGVTLNISGPNILKVGRNFVNNGTVVSNTSTLEFDEYAGWGTVYLTSNGSSLYNLVINLYSATYDLDLQDNLTVSNDLTVVNGDLDVTGNNYSITIGGSWTIESNGEFQRNSGTVTFNGAGAGSAETITTNNEPFYNLTFSAANTTYSLQDELSLNNDLSISGGTLDLNGKDLNMGDGSGDDLTLADSLVVDEGSRLRLASGAALNVNSSGTVEVAGVAGNPGIVTNQGSGTYSFDVNSGGNIGAQYYTFEFMDTDGIYIHDGATVNTSNDFSNGTFTNGSSAGTLLRVDNSQTLATINNVSFPTDPGSGASNVMKSLDQGNLTFVDASGAFQGESNEDDTNSRITWSYTTTERQWNGSASTNWATAANWTPTQVPTSNNRVVIPSAPANQPLLTSTTDSCFHLTIENGASLTLGDGSNGGELFVIGDVNLNGTLRFSNDNDTLRVEGNWSNSGTFTHNSRGAVIFTGTNEQNIAPGGTGSGKTFYDFTVNKTGGRVILAAAVKVDNDLSLIDGEFDVSSGNYGVEIDGDWLKADTAIFNYQVGTVTISGTNGVITGSGSDDFYNLDINASGVTLGSALDVKQDLIISSGASLDVTTSNYGISVTDDWTNSGTFNARNGGVVFDGVGQNIGGGSTTTFNNITFENSGTKTLSVNANVSGNLWINNCTLDLNTYTIDGTGASNLFSMGNGTNLYVEGLNNFPTNFEDFSIAEDSYVRYNRAGDQTITGIDGDGGVIEYGYLRLQNSGTKTVNNTLDVNSDLYVANNVTFNLNSNNMTVGRYWDNNQGGSFTAGTGNTVTFDRDGQQNIYPSASGDTFPSMVFGGTGNKILYGNIAVSGNLTLNSGINYLNLQTYSATGSGGANTLNVSSDVTLYVRGANNFPTGFEIVNLAASSITRYDGNLAQNIRTQDGDSDQIQYGDIYFRYNTKTLDGDLDARGRFYIYGVTTLDVSAADSYNINVGERWYNLGTTNLYNNTVTLDGSGEQRIYSYGTTDAKKFHHLVINKPADSYLYVYTYDVQVDSNVTFSSGTMYNDRTIFLEGNWNSGVSATMDNRGTVAFSGAGQTVTGTGNADFYVVNFNGSGTKTLGSNLGISDDITIGSGVTLDVSVNDYQVSIQDDFTNSGSLEPRQGTVVFTGTGTQYVYTNGTAAGKQFYNFKVDKTGGSCYLRGHLRVNNNILLQGNTAGAFRPDGYNIFAYGSWYNTSPLQFVAGNGEVTFSGTTKDSIQTGYTASYNNAFYDLTVNNPDSIIHVDNIRVNNSYILQQGTVLLNGKEFFFGATANGNDVFDVTAENGDATFELGTNGQLKVRRGNSVNIASSANTSTIRVVGEENQDAVVTYWGTTQYGFNVGTGGRIYARYYHFSYMDTAGIKIDGGQVAGAGADTTEDFSNGTFSNGVAGGRYFYVNNSQTMQIDSIDFSNSLGASGENVRKPNDAGRLTFFNTIGIYSGESYENDPYDRIDWVSNTSENRWEGDVSSDWHTAGNWSNSSVPTSTDNVIIPNVATDPLISNNDAQCADLNIETGGLLQIGNSRDIVAGGNFRIYGTLTLFGTDTVTIGGDYENSGTLNPSNGAFVFNGVQQSLNSGGTATNRQFNSIVVTNNATVTLSSNNLLVKNDLTINTGATLDVSSSNRLIYIGGAWTNSGTFNYRAGTVEFNGSSAQTVSGSGSNDFYNLEFSGTGTKTFSGTLDINGDIVINSGSTVNGGTSTVYLNEYFNNNGTFTGSNSSFIFDRAGTQYIQGSNTPAFGNLQFAGSGNKLLSVGITVNGNFNIQSGVSYLNLQTYTVNGSGGSDNFSLGSGVRLYVRGSNNFPANFEDFTLASDSYVRYDGNLTQTVRTQDAEGDTIQYGWLEIYHQGEFTNMRILENGGLSVAGRLQVNAGDTLDITANNYDIWVGENCYIYGYLLANGSSVQNTITMNGSVTQTFLAPGSGTGKELYNLIIAKSAGYCTFSGTSDVYVNNDLTISSGELRANGNRNIYVKGDWNCTSGSFDDATSTIHFDPTSHSGIIETNGSEFYNVEFDGGTTTYSMQDNMTVMENLTINSGNTLDLNGNTLNFGNGSDLLTVNGILDVDAGAQLRMYNLASLTVASGGRINIVGTSGNIARVSRHSTTGSYSFEVQAGATIAAQYYLFEYMNQNGIYVNGATIDLTNNFSNGTFTNGVTNGKFLAINNNSQNLTGGNRIQSVQFPSNPGGTSYNVYVTNSSSGSYNFEDASGSFEGDAYEYDPDNVVSWTYTIVTREWTGTQNSDWHTANNWSPQSVPSASEHVIITSTSNLPVISNSDAVCNNLSINGGSLTLRDGNNLAVSGNLSIASGATFTVNSNQDTVYLNGDWSNGGSFAHGNSIVVFQGDNVQNLTSGGTSSVKRFYNIHINKGATAEVSITDNDLRADRDIRISSGRLASGNRTIYVGKSWYNTGGTFESGSGTVNFIGSEGDSVQTNGSDFYGLTINGSGGSIRAVDNVRVENDLLITAGTLYADGNEISVGNASGNQISVQGILDINANAIVRVQGGSNGINIESGGQLTAIGSDASNLAEVTRYGSSGYYPVIFNNGSTLNARYAKFSYTDGSGVNVSSGATVNATNRLEGCVFENGSGNSYLRISNNQNLGTINGVIFNGGSSTPTYNIIYDGSGSLTFNNYKGQMAGARLESDNGTDPVGNVRWVFNENQSISGSGTYTFGNDFEITVNNAGDLTAINVELVDSRYNNYSNVYSRYCVITSTPASPSGYNVNIRSYYADGTNNSSNEIPNAEDDTMPYLWSNTGGGNNGPYYSSHNTSQNWVAYNNVTSDLAASWFISNETEDTSLPVELSVFTAAATEEGIELKWVTESELNNLKWIIRRKESGSDEKIEVIAEIDGMGTVSAKTEYSYQDENIKVDTEYEYTLVSISFSGLENEEGTVSVKSLKPEKFELLQNYPNPFNGGTTIKFSVPEAGEVEIVIYNALGQKVMTLDKKKFDPGFYKYQWDGRNGHGSSVATGVYFYILKGKNVRLVKKMVYMK